MVATCQYTFVKTHRTCDIKVNPSLNSGLKVIMMCQCRFISYSKITTVVQKVNSGEGCMYRNRKSMAPMYFLLNSSVNLKLFKNYVS